ncbi:hypothetical protein COL21_08230 [Bacillus thuringiensis]|uniref:hypothetical protein n=1 Tax=Bacillus thuringiensis TaxID=1428 RepID=UPI000BF434DE|nr:hypothetical protein [Bacillus thuringiensis]PFW00422.1 hypothetical protein COL21_08230 [Bacillus thuringiensis]
MANKKLKINIDADTTEVLKQMREVTEAANECVEALEKLEKVMSRLTNKQGFLLIEVPITLNGKTIAKKVSDFTNIKERF